MYTVYIRAVYKLFIHRQIRVYCSTHIHMCIHGCSHTSIHSHTQARPKLYLTAKLGWTRASIAPTEMENSDQVLRATVPYKIESAQVSESTAIAADSNEITCVPQHPSVPAPMFAC
jgi:hypothetical protein